MDTKQTPTHSHLFTLRVWPEDMGDGRIEWRGQVKHVLSGETSYFRDWPTLIAHLQQSLATDGLPETAES
jgi:hypothetical protein